MARKRLFLGLLGLLFLAAFAVAEDTTDDSDPVVEEDLGKSRDGSRTDDETVKREEEAIKIDGMSVSEMKEMRDKSEKHQFQAEVDRMMKLIINSLYKNKEIFLRELISNGSDALDKIRFLSLTDKNALHATDDMSIKIKADKENNALHVCDTGIGMSKDELVKNLGTIAKSGTSDFLTKLGEASSNMEMSDLIGQFGVGFYSSFLVADRVVVTSKSNDDDQYIWESDAASFNIAKDPRGDTLGRGTCVSLYMKEEAHEYLEQSRVKELVTKYSQFINFNIYLWDSKTEKVDEPIEDDSSEEKPPTDGDEDGTVEEESEDKSKTRSVDKTIWDYDLVNDNKPLWTRKPAEIEDDEYTNFYKSFSKDTDDPMARTHFTAEGEVTFKSILFIPKTSPTDMFQSYGKKIDYIKMYVRRVFITDNFEDMMPKYLSFVKGVVDSDDLPLNVSRETLQQHKLLKVIKKKLVRKTLDMIKKIDKEEYDKFWKEYSTNIKLGVIEDHSNRTRLAKLLRFYSSNHAEDQTSLPDYIERMKEKQEHIYFMAGGNRKEVEESPFVERLLKRGYEVLYLVEAVDEYCIQSLPEFEGKKFQNVAKEGLKMEESEQAKERKENLDKEYEPLLKWLKDDALGDRIEKATVSDRLSNSPCALVASSYGWSANMERIMKAQAYQKAKDSSNEYYSTQKKTLEVNPRHPLVKELRRRVENDKEDQTTKDLAMVLFETATLRSGFMLQDSAEFAGRIERMLKLSMDISLDEQVEEEPEDVEEVEEDYSEFEGDPDAEGEGEESEDGDSTSEDGSEDKEACTWCSRRLLMFDGADAALNKYVKDSDGDGIPDDEDDDDDNDGIPDYLDDDDDGDGIPDYEDLNDDTPSYLQEDDDQPYDDDEGYYDDDEIWGKGIDTDGDGIPDYLDDDDDNDGIPDDEDDDDDGNGIPDHLEVDTDGDGVPDYLDDDDDGDGIPDDQDNDDDGDGIPDDQEGIDTDGDGVPDYLDDDADGDGIPDHLEGDTDGDGIPDYLDDDDDGDGIPDDEDTDDDGDGIPDTVESKDTDGDGIPDHLDTDDDGDGIPDHLDTDDDGDGVPDVDEIDKEKDTDGDGIPDYIDDDDDNDGIPDDEDDDDDGDGIPDWMEVDTDGDGVPDYLDDDDDGDGIPDDQDDDDDGDGIPDDQEGIDTDGDGVPDYLDDDADGDGIPDHLEGDTDGDGIPDYLDDDDDGDGIPDDEDTDDDGDGIPDTEESKDTDGDGIPDHLDADDDGDGVPDVGEVDKEKDTDGDGIPDYLDDDDDNDGIPDDEDDDDDGDGIPDWMEVDTDGDGVPDYLDDDDDGDGIPDAIDNDDDGGGTLDDDILDTDGDGIPDHLDDDDDGNGIPDAEDDEPLVSRTVGVKMEDKLEQDTDGDGIPDYLDDDDDGDGVPDHLDEDLNDNGIPDHLEVDSDGDGVPDYLDDDDDNDGIPDELDDDADGNGIPDIQEGKVVDSDGDGIPDHLDDDDDNDGIPDHLDDDDDGDGIPDHLEERVEKPRRETHPHEDHTPKVPDLNDKTEDEGEEGSLMSRIIDSLKSMVLMEEEEEEEKSEDDHEGEVDLWDVVASWLLGGELEPSKTEENNGRHSVVKQDNAEHNFKSVKRQSGSEQAEKGSAKDADSVDILDKVLEFTSNTITSFFGGDTTDSRGPKKRRAGHK